MKFSEKWLREWVNPAISTEELGEQLTSLGLEVDSIVSCTPLLSEVVVARVVDVYPHPDADRLRICEVDNGTSDLLQIVCGAPNVQPGLVTVLANVGCPMPDGKLLKKAKLRGVESFGMLCSAAEIGLSEQNTGLMELDSRAPVGDSLISYLELDDEIIDIDLTPDRGDCLSIRGIARDLCALNDMPLQLHEISPVSPQIDTVHPVRLSPTSCCARYTSRVVSGVSMRKGTPIWISERLRRSGVRSINPAVDVTNYVMLELGQPMHAFDADKLQGNVQVRPAAEGEKIVLLDGREVTLTEDTTVIADNSGAIGIAGIMGGLSTAVSESTQNILFESALFLPDGIAGKPRQYAAHSDSSHRFERGVDPSLQRDALEYATGLLITLAGGKAGPVRDWHDASRLPKGEPVEVRRARMTRIIGIPMDDEQVERIFSRLGIDYDVSDEGWIVEPPSYRYDLRIEEDFIEEVARVFGFNNLPRTLPPHQPSFRPVPETEVTPLELKKQLASQGYQEVVTYSFVEAAPLQLVRPDLTALSLANPISADMSAMRTTLVLGLLETMRHNQNRQMPSMRLFETGLRFLPLAENDAASVDSRIVANHGDDLQISEDLQQQSMLAGLAVGQTQPEGWSALSAEVDFFDIKADLQSLFASASANTLEFVDTDFDLLHPGQRCGIVCNTEVIGYMGRLHPEVQKSLDLSTSAIVFEISLAALTRAKVPQIAPVSRLPSVRRDIALLVDDTVSHQSVINCVRKHGPDCLRDIVTFDVYQGEKVEKGKKSIALGLILQDFSRTLEEAEIEQAVARIVKAAGKDLGAVLRV